MCGRFCCSFDPNTIKAKLHESHITNSNTINWVNEEKYSPSYNVAPTNHIIVLHADPNNKEQVLHSMQWGYVPSWSRNISMNKPINAREETLMEKSMFESSKDTKRCIVIAEGFYEWKRLSNNKKQPYFIKRKDGQLMLFAGLYDVNSFIGNNLYTCTIITTHSSEFFAQYHNRMPVVLEPDNVKKWVNKNIPWSEEIADLLQPSNEELICYQVSDQVGSVKVDKPDLIVPVDTKKSSISYFLKEEKPEIKFEKFALEQEFNNALNSSSFTLSTKSANGQESGKRRRSSSAESMPSKKKVPSSPKKDDKKSMKITSFFGKK